MIWLNNNDELLAVNAIRILYYPGLGSDKFCLMATATGRYGEVLEIPLKKASEQEVRDLFRAIRKEVASRSLVIWAPRD